jgi:hypothetical protein
MAYTRHSGESRAQSEALSAIQEFNSTIWIPAVPGMTLQKFPKTDRPFRFYYARFVAEKHNILFYENA